MSLLMKGGLKLQTLLNNWPNQQNLLLSLKFIVVMLRAPLFEVQRGEITRNIATSFTRLQRVSRMDAAEGDTSLQWTH